MLRKTHGVGAVRCALPHFVARNDLPCLMYQCLEHDRNFVASLNCVALNRPDGPNRLRQVVVFIRNRLRIVFAASCDKSNGRQSLISRGMVAE